MILFLNIVTFTLVAYLQSSLLARFDIFGLMPNLALILITAFSFHRKTYMAYIFAFVYGLVLDSISGGPFGIHIATFMLIVFACSLLSEETRSTVSTMVSTVVILVASAVFYLSFWIILSWQSKNFAFSGILFVLGEILVTTGVFVVTFPYLKKFFLWEEAVEARK